MKTKMKKLLSFMLAVLMIASLACMPAMAYTPVTAVFENTTELYDKESMVLFAVKGTPNQIDGKKDGAWEHALAISSDPKSEKYDSDAFFRSPSVDYYLMWDENNLYILEDRRNESIENVPSNVSSPNGWSAYDCTTYSALLPTEAGTGTYLAGAVHLSTTPKVTSASATGATSDTWIWGSYKQIRLDTAESRLTQSSAGLTPSTAGIQSQTSRTETGYMVETAIPWSTLDAKNKDDFTAQIYQVFGLKIYNNAGKGGARWHVNEGLAYTSKENGSEKNTKDFEGYAQVQLVGGSISPDLSWYNVDDTVYAIGSAADLYGLAALSQAGETFAGKIVKLTADIDLNPNWTASVSVDETTKAVTMSAAPNPFPGLATFAGTLDGQGHIIKGIYMNKSDITSHYGFISTMTEGAIKDIVFTNSLIYSSTANGNGTNFGIAGLIGCANVTDSKTIDIENVYVDIDVVNRRTDHNEKTMVGGLIGRVDNRTYATGGNSGAVIYAQNVKSTVYAGTIITAHADSNDAEMYATQTVLNVSQLCAGGQTNGVNSVAHGAWCFTNCVTLGDTAYASGKNGSAHENYGECKNDFINLIEGAKAEGSAIDQTLFKAATTGHTQNVQPWVYYKPSYAIDAFAYSEAAQAIVPTRVAEMLDRDVTYVENTTGTTADTVWYSEGGINVYYISDAADLLGFSYLSRTWEIYQDIYGFKSQEDVTKAKVFYLTDDIDLNPDWTLGESEANLNTFGGIATMYGIFDGQGHTISGIYNNAVMPHRATDNYGLIGTLYTGGKLRNVVLKNGKLTADADSIVGSIVGSVAGDSCVIENVYSNLTVTGADEAAAGGLVGAVTGSDFALSSAVYLGTVTGKEGSVGDLIGQISSDVAVTDCVYVATAYGATDQNVTETRVLVKNEQLASENAFRADEVYKDYDWAMVKGEIMMPVIVAEMFNYNVYVQESQTPDIENGVTRLRIISVLDSLKWRRIGFYVTVSFADGRSVTKKYTTDTVYTSVMAANEVVTAQSLGGTYIYGLVIDNISLNRVVKIEVTPAKTTLNGTEVAMRSSMLYYKEGQTLISGKDSEVFMPEYTQGTPSFTHLPDDESSLRAYENATEADYEAYVEKLRENGLKITEYTMENNRYALCEGYYNTFYVSYLANTNTVKVYAEVAGLNNYPELSTAKNYESGYAKFWQLNVDCLGSRQNGGMSYLFQAVDGTFVVIDGGYNTEKEADQLYNLMKANVPEGDTPVIAAWYISHLHGDHIGGLFAFADKYADEIDVQSFYYHFDYKGSPSASKPQMQDYMSRGLWHDAIHYARLHSGMNFNIKGIKVEVFYTVEDIYPTTAESYEFNNTSMVIRTTVGAEKRTVMFLGDIMRLASDYIVENFTSASLKSDFVQFSHHGYEGATQAVYDAIQAPAVLWPMNVVGNQANYSTVPQNVFVQWYQKTSGTEGAMPNRYICQSATYVKQIIVSGMGTALIDLSVDPHYYTGSKLPDFNAYYEAHKSEGNV